MSVEGPRAGTEEVRKSQEGQGRQEEKDAQKATARAKILSVFHVAKLVTFISYFISHVYLNLSGHTVAAAARPAGVLMMRPCDFAFANSAAVLVSRHLRHGSSALVNSSGGKKGYNLGAFSFRPRCCLSTAPNAAAPAASDNKAAAVDSSKSAGTRVFEEEITVLHSEDGQRVDKVLSGRYERRSRAYFQQLISGGNVTISGLSKVGKSHKVSTGEVINVRLMVPEREQPIKPENIPLDVLYEDEHIAVINKSAGIVVHPAPGHWSGTLAHALVHRYGTGSLTGGDGDSDNTYGNNGEGDVTRAGIVHRLDKGTSGALIIARTREAHDMLSTQFAAREVEKEYLAITVGSPGGEGVQSGVIDAPIGRDAQHRIRMDIVQESDGGKSALSTYRILARDSRAFLHLINIGIHTGRTHQIRVHLRHKRAPVLGDDLYGALDINRRYKSAATRPLLHAYKLRFKHPITDEIMEISAPVPDDMKNIINKSLAQDASVVNK